MNTYIFYTNEGFTEDMHNQPIENCQILGWATGKDETSAFANFKKENNFLLGRFKSTLCQKIVSEKVYSFELN